MAKRVLVTGGAGFISSNFIHHLLAKTPYEVVSLDALTYAGNIDNLDGAMSHERLSFVQGDIRDAELVRDIVAEVDVIVNAAAESQSRSRSKKARVNSSRPTWRGRRFCSTRFARLRWSGSSCSPRARSTAPQSPRPWTKSIRSTPRSPYAATKAGADRLAYSYFVTYGLPVVIVRPFNNYGPRQHPEKVMPRFITQALQDRPDDPRRRPCEPRLALRGRRRRGDRGRDRTRRSRTWRARC